VPSASDFEERAADNEQLFLDLGGAAAQASDWAMTLLFYCAVNEVKAFLKRKKPYLLSVGIQNLPKRHAQRLALLDKEWPAMADVYRTLKNASEAARYDCGVFTEAQLTLAYGQLRALRQQIADAT
jgi:hypothetical protein